MRTNTVCHSILFVALLMALLPAQAPASTVKLKTTGTYADKSGNRYPWEINESHALLWNGSAYVPRGVVFCPQSIVSGADESYFQSDISALQALKSNGITDIIVNPPLPITSSDSKALQRLLDYLDSEGFSYGLALRDGPSEALKGYLISPSRYRLEGPNPQRKIVCSWPDVDSAIYVIARKSDNSIKSLGGAVVGDGKVTINLPEPLAAGEVLLVYPRKTFQPVSKGGSGDLWTGFGEYRDRLLEFFKNIKFGQGLRFFLDPFVCQPDFASEVAEFLPDSPGFRLGLEAYLTKKYTHEGGLNTAWGFVDLASSIEEACRVIPFWGQGRGLAYAYDRASAKLYSVNATSSQLWRDITDYRDASIQEQMNAIADILHKYVADVPVLFSCRTHHRVFANPYGMGGYDGLVGVVEGLGERVVAKRAGSAYALAEESAKTTWFISVVSASGSGNGSESLADTLILLQEIGCKGFFLERPSTGSRPVSADADEQPSSIMVAWTSALSEFKKKQKDDEIADYKPTVVSYPTVPAVGAFPRRLIRNSWWLPSLRVGSSSYIGDGFFAYSFVGEDKTYLWSGTGVRTVTFKAALGGYPTVEFPPRSDITRKKGGQFAVTLTDIPVVLRGMDVKLVFPYETAVTEVQRLADAIVEADKAGFDVKNARATLESAKTVLEKGSPLTAYGMAQQSLLELLKLLGGELWLEGEQPLAHSFDGVSAWQGASGNLVLLIDTDKDPPLSPFIATFAFDAPLNSSYEIWLAGTLPTEGSAVSFAVDDANWQAVTQVSDLQNYAAGLAWYKIGTANLLPGRHTISLRLDGRRPSDKRYYFAIDAFVLSPKGFKPNGVIKPF
jgi:hypothetical protein